MARHPRGQRALGAAGRVAERGVGAVGLRARLRADDGAVRHRPARSRGRRGGQPRRRHPGDRLGPRARRRHRAAAARARRVPPGGGVARYQRGPSRGGGRGDHRARLSRAPRSAPRGVASAAHALARRELRRDRDAGRAARRGAGAADGRRSAHRPAPGSRGGVGELLVRSGRRTPRQATAERPGAGALRRSRRSAGRVHRRLAARQRAARHPRHAGAGRGHAGRGARRPRLTPGVRARDPAR